MNKIMILFDEQNNALFGKPNNDIIRCILHRIMILFDEQNNGIIR
jgi:hypothetical protein